MKITWEMLAEAMGKAFELGLIPPHSHQNLRPELWDGMREVIAAALEVGERDRLAPQARRLLPEGYPLPDTMANVIAELDQEDDLSSPSAKPDLPSGDRSA